MHCVCWTDSENGDSCKRVGLAESSLNNSPIQSACSSAALCTTSQTAFKPVTPRRSVSYLHLLLINYRRFSVAGAKLQNSLLAGLAQTDRHGPWQASAAHSLKPCPHCRRKRRLSPKTVRKRRQSHFSATVWTCHKRLLKTYLFGCLDRSALGL